VINISQQGEAMTGVKIFRLPAQFAGRALNCSADLIRLIKSWPDTTKAMMLSAT
jgi:hypothetical protein